MFLEILQNSLVFFCEFCKISKHTFFTEHLCATAFIQSISLQTDTFREAFFKNWKIKVKTWSRCCISQYESWCIISNSIHKQWGFFYLFMTNNFEVMSVYWPIFQKNFQLFKTYQRCSFHDKHLKMTVSLSTIFLGSSLFIIPKFNTWPLNILIFYYLNN